jgi:hypothetical protein
MNIFCVLINVYACREFYAKLRVRRMGESGLEGRTDCADLDAVGLHVGVGSEATGCQFVSNVQPPKSSSGLTRTDLHDFSVGGLTSGINGIFERESYPDYGGNATIIGVRHGTKWKFYVQSYGNDPTGSGYFAINASKRFA